ncbi:MAG: hypothetical protein ACOYL3_06695 [Desulfuromonadaceae bacterium]
MSKFKIKPSTLSSNQPINRVHGAHMQKILQLVSAALQKFMAASARPGQDCYQRAVFAQSLLTKLGVDAKLVVGFTAWRIGNGDGDVIAHHPTSVGHGAGFMFHAWLEIGNNILDFTTYQLRLKAAMIDAIDGFKTNVVWCPEYLYVPKTSVSSYNLVRDKHAGLYHYQYDAPTEAMLRSAAKPADPADIEQLWQIYQNPNAQVHVLLSSCEYIEDLAA